MGTWKTSASAVKRNRARWLRRHGIAFRLAGCFVLVALTTAFASFKAATILIWVANGLLLSYLLLAPRRRWAAYLGVGFAAQLTASQLVYPYITDNLLMVTLNIAEVWISALLMRRKTRELPDFTDSAYLLRFAAYAVLVGPLAVGVAYALIYVFWLHEPFFSSLFDWVVSDGLGAAISTPAFVAIFMSRFRAKVNWKKNWVHLLVFVTVIVLAFVQVRTPALFLVYPLLILVTIRMGPAWAALGTLFMAGVATRCTMAGLGPFAAMAAVIPGEPGILMQGFLAVGVFMVYTVSMLMEGQRKAESRLKEIASLHTLVTENSRDVIVVSDFAGLHRYFSPAVERLTGWPAEHYVDHRLRDAVHPEDRPRVEETLRSMRSGRETAQIEYRFQKPNGEWVWAETNMMLFRDQKTDKPAGILDFIRDITERKHAEQSREFHHSLIRAIHEVSPAGILVVDENGNVVSINRRFAEVWRVSAPGTSASQREAIIAPDERLLAQCVEETKDPKGFLKRVRELYADHDATDECEVEMKDGRTLERFSTSLQSEGGQYLGRVWFFTDITERKRAEQQLQSAYKSVAALSAVDSLTGLANRRRFDESLTLEWRRAIRENTPISLMLVDVDHFKSYNDTYGHLQGDDCLRQIACSALNSVARPGDLVSRYGGDEFTIILANTENEGAMKVGNAVCARVRDCGLRHDTNPRGVVTVSVGCATIIPKAGLEASTLIDLADRALYSAKRDGRDMTSNGYGAAG